MGAIAQAVKQVITLGGGQGWSTPASGDVVYANLPEERTVSADRAMSFIPFYAAVKLISEDLASLPFGVYARLPVGRDRRSDHWLDPILRRQANPFMDAMVFRETLQAHALTWGNGYAEIEYATDGTVLHLWPLRPDRMEVRLDTATRRIFYRYELPGGQKADLPRRKVFHVHGLGFDGLVGYSVISKAGRTLNMALRAETYNSDYLAKGQIPPAVLTHPTSLSDPARARLRDDWDSIDHRNRVAILEEGVKLETIGLPPSDIPLVETFGHSRSLMATLFRLPPEMLSDVERSTSWGSGIEQQNIAYVVRTLRAWITRWEMAVDTQLLTDEARLYSHMTVDALMRGDAASRWASYGAGINNGVYTVNDVLELEDRNPISDEAGGNIRRAPLNMVPLDQWRDASLRDRIEMLGVLVRAGFQPTDAAEAIGVPDIEHTGLEPVTVTEQSSNGSPRSAT